MSVYVDNMKAPFGRMIMCHMIADTEEELHAMARAIGIARRWYQRNHYDICLSKRAKAVSLGAKEISRMDLGRMVIAQRRKKTALCDAVIAIASAKKISVTKMLKETSAGRKDASGPYN